MKTYSLEDWLKLHNISRAYWYKLVSKGMAPKTFKVMSRIRITEEANNEWLAARIAESAA
jgi:predicted DNA-binding transcriptional regulator AlpA